MKIKKLALILLVLPTVYSLTIKDWIIEPSGVNVTWTFPNEKSFSQIIVWSDRVKFNNTVIKLVPIGIINGTLISVNQTYKEFNLTNLSTNPTIDITVSNFPANTKVVMLVEPKGCYRCNLSNSTGSVFFYYDSGWSEQNFVLAEDTTPPTVTDVFVTPGEVDKGELVNISAFVTDDYHVDTVMYNITNVTLGVSILGVMTDYTGGTWYATLNTSLLKAGYNYTVQIIANDTCNNINDTETNWDWDSPFYVRPLERNTTQPFVATDLLERTYFSLRAFAQSLIFTDLSWTLASLFRIVTDTTSFIANTIRLVSFRRFLSFNIYLTEVVQRVQYSFRQISQSMIVTDSIKRYAYFFRNLPQSLAIADTISRVYHSLRVSTLSLSILDAISRLASFWRTTTQSLIITANTVINIIPKLPELTLTITDQIKRTTYNFRSSIQSLTLTANTLINIIPKLPELDITITDSITRYAYFFRAATTSFIISETKTGSALEFDGNDFVNVSDSNSLDITDQLTIEAWFKLAGSTGTWNGIVLKSAYTENYGLMYQSAAGLETIRFYHPGLTSDYTTYNKILSTNRWYHIVATWNGTHTKIYLDGDLKVTDLNSGTLTTNTNPLYIGADVSNGFYFYGTLEEVRVYNRSLSQEEITYSHKTYSPLNQNGLVGWWKFNENGGQTTSDATAYNNDGVLGSSTSEDSNDPTWVAGILGIKRIYHGFRMATQSLTIIPILSRLISLYRSITQPISLTLVTERAGAFYRVLSQSITLTDLATRLRNVFRVLSQSITITEVVNRVYSGFRVISQSLTLTDVSSRVAYVYRTLAQAVSISDLVDRFYYAFRTVSQSVTLTANTLINIIPKLPTLTITVTDQISRIGYYFRTNPLSLSVTALVDRLASFYRAITQSLTVTLQISRVYHGLRVAIQSLTVSDLVERRYYGFRALTQALTISDIATRIQYTFRSITQTINIVDLISRIKRGVGTLTQSIQVTALVSRIQYSYRTISQPVSVTAQTLINIIPKLPELVITIAESVSRVASYFRISTQTITITDLIDRIQYSFRTSPLIINLVDSISRVYYGFRILSQSLTITDLVSRIQLSYRTITQPIGISEVVDRVVYNFRTVTQVIQVTDVLERLSLFFRNLPQSLAIADLVARIGLFSRNIPQALAITDLLSRVSYIFRTLTQTFTISDVLMRVKNIPRITLQTMLVSELIERVGEFYRIISQPLSVKDLIARVLSPFRTLTQPLTIIDQISRSVTRYNIKIITETIPITVVIKRTAFLFREISQTLTLSLLTERVKTVFRMLTQPLPISEMVSRVYHPHRILAQTISVSDIVNRVYYGFRIVTQTVPITDVVSRIYQSVRAITQQINFKFVLDRVAFLRKAITQTLSITDILVRIKKASRIVTQTLALSDLVKRTSLLVRNIPQTLTVTGLTKRVIYVYRQITQSLLITTITKRSLLAYRTISQTISITDVIERIGSLIIVTTQTIPVTDVVSRITHQFRIITQLFNIQILTKWIGYFYRIIPQPVNLQFVTKRVYYGLRTLTQALAVSDIIDRVYLSHRTILEPLKLTVLISRIQYTFRSITQALTVSELVTRIQVSVRILSQTVSLTDLVNRIYSSYRVLTQPISLQLLTQRISYLYRTLTQTLSITIVTQRVASFYRTVSQSISLVTKILRFALPILEWIYYPIKALPSSIIKLVLQVKAGADALTNFFVKLVSSPELLFPFSNYPQTRSISLAAREATNLTWIVVTPMAETDMNVTAIAYDNFTDVRKSANIILTLRPFARLEARLIMGSTEYLEGETLDIKILLEDEVGDPVTNASCLIDLWYPDNTQWLNDIGTAELESGIYYNNSLTAPKTTGIYTIAVNCTKDSISATDSSTFHVAKWASIIESISAEQKKYFPQWDILFFEWEDDYFVKWHADIISLGKNWDYLWNQFNCTYSGYEICTYLKNLRTKLIQEAELAYQYAEGYIDIQITITNPLTTESREKWEAKLPLELTKNDLVSLNGVSVKVDPSTNRLVVYGEDLIPANSTITKTIRVKNVWDKELLISEVDKVMEKVNQIVDSIPTDSPYYTQALAIKYRIQELADRIKSKLEVETPEEVIKIWASVMADFKEIKRIEQGLEGMVSARLEGIEEKKGISASILMVVIGTLATMLALGILLYKKKIKVEIPEGYARREYYPRRYPVRYYPAYPRREYYPIRARPSYQYEYPRYGYLKEERMPKYRYPEYKRSSQR